MASTRPSTERAVLLLATLVALGGIAGSIWAASPASAPDGPLVESDVADRYESIEGIAGTRTTTLERNGTVTSSRTYAVEMRPGTGEERLSLVDGRGRYDLRLSNGSVLWLYDRSAANVTRFTLGDADSDRTRGERIERLFARLNSTTVDGETPAERPTVEPLPVVPQSAASQADATRSAGTPLDVSYGGTATVDDRAVHVVRLTPVNDTAAPNYEQTLWIDTEHYFPLKQRTAWTRDGERTVQTTTYANVTFDPGLDDATFTPDFPANATVRSPETPETTAYRDVSDLREATNVQVPDPSVPPTYELTYVTRTDGRVRGVGLRYVNRTSVLTVAKYNFTYPAEAGDEQVSIDGRTGELTRGRRTTLSWNCDSYRYTVRGTGLSRDAVVAVGKSVGCPDAGT